MKEKTCDVCEEDIWLHEPTETRYLRIEESNWNDRSDGFDFQDIPINFCYKCGKDYRKTKLK
ncbi:hypothetical protein COL28_20645 [Bacillus thuringiensis]|uniref:hypothetical protein n=1 Tax=Bacillus thuringiensis TaxID=1428 RepID=UPI000BFA3B07|nr:hypothetical protein [Bacillus thuringiensis]PFW41342.1 hypothetical protein COL28_20645 [Bacillus thuringiensis]